LIGGRQTRLVGAVLVGAFIIKAVLLFVVLPAVSKSVSPTYSIGFADLYDLIGDNVARGVGYRVEAGTTDTMMREPGYPLFLAGVFKIGGYNIEAARFANLLLAVGIALMLMRLARKLTDDPAVPLVGTLLFLFYPAILVSEARGGIEIVFIFVVMLFMLALHQAVEKGERWRYLVAGASLGVVVLFRGSPMVFPAFLLGYFLLTANSLAERFRSMLNIGILVLGMLVVMTPWVYRNYLLSGRLVLTATVQGISAQEGQFTCERLSAAHEFKPLQDEAAMARNAVAAQLGRPFIGFYYQYFYSPLDEMAFNDRLLSNVTTHYRNNPMLLPRCVAQNLFFNFWFLGKTWGATSLNAVVQLPLLGFALSGVYLLWKRGRLRKVALILGFSVCIVAVHVLVIAHARHSVPIVPFLSMLASISLVAIWRSWRTHLTAASR
jgi:4-amino-4-deoxy-L-arabinose transferase-like glycosyltransferase